MHEGMTWGRLHFQSGIVMWAKRLRLFTGELGEGRREPVERYACHRAGIFRPVEDLRVVAADGRGHAHRRRRR